MLENYKGQIETKFSASYQYKRIAIRSKKQFRTNDIEYIVECLNEKFEKYAMSRLKWASKPKIESDRITPNFPFSVVFVYSENCFNKMSPNTAEKLCPKFKILRQKSSLNIDFSLVKCLKHSFDIVKVCLNYKSNIDIVTKRIVFEHLVFKDYKLQKYQWFLEPDYGPRKTIGIKSINFENVVEFVFTRQRDPLVRCNSLDNVGS